MEPTLDKLVQGEQAEYGLEVLCASWNPLGTIERQRARWDQAVEMEVIAQGLIPGVKHTEETE